MRAKGLSLIEVVVSLVLIGTTATMLLTAHSRSLEQLRATSNSETASILARELITQWKLEPPDETSPMDGRFESHPKWGWAGESVPYPSQGQSELQQVTLTIHRTDQRGFDQIVVTYTWLERPHGY